MWDTYPRTLLIFVSWRYFVPHCLFCRKVLSYFCTYAVVHCTVMLLVMCDQHHLLQTVQFCEMADESKA